MRTLTDDQSLPYHKNMKQIAIAAMLLLTACENGRNENIPLISIGDIGDACIVLSAAACDRVITCDSFDVSRGECEVAIFDACCRDAGTCNILPAFPASEVWDCVDAYESHPCEEIERGINPLVCQGVIR